MADNRKKLKRSGHEILSDSSEDEFVLSASSYSNATKVSSSITTRSAMKSVPNSESSQKNEAKPTKKTTTSATLTESIVFESIKKVNVYTNKEPVAKGKVVGSGIKHNGTRHAVARMFQSYPRYKTTTLTFGTKVNNLKAPPQLQERAKQAHEKKVRLDKKYAFDKSYKRVGLHVFKSPSSATKKGNQNEKKPSNEGKLSSTATSRLVRKYVPPTITNNLHDTSPLPKCFKKEYPFGSIVQIPGPTLDAEKWENKPSPPHFLGAIMNPDDLDPNVNLYCNNDESLVEFILAGEYKWLEKRKQNTILKVVKDNEITIKCLPPHLCINSKPHEAEDYKKWFVCTKTGWRVATFRGPCDNCGSPFCLYHHKKEQLRTMLLKISNMKDLSNNAKRFRSYNDAVKEHFPHLGEGNRVRLGMCFVEMVRGLFPDESYKGFRYSDYHSDEGW